MLSYCSPYQFPLLPVEQSGLVLHSLGLIRSLIRNTSTFSAMAALCGNKKQQYETTVTFYYHMV
ncbi:hypothetical protein [Vibrio gallaecicus]|uniref:hypothetical protein n=1 Tax=Vibrio gallaecicus TaxID=552386 RepID=UPI0025B4047D|nr:hypothetical protein [Vibrio gallaecicus]MDN3614010.1 hypothetical protein [Vibrio gallaecicus]